MRPSVNLSFVVVLLIFLTSDLSRADDHLEISREAVFCDAVLTTDGFVLKAPKIEVFRGPRRFKINALSEIKA